MFFFFWTGTPTFQTNVMPLINCGHFITKLICLQHSVLDLQDRIRDRQTDRQTDKVQYAASYGTAPTQARIQVSILTLCSSTILHTAQRKKSTIRAPYVRHSNPYNPHADRSHCPLAVRLVLSTSALQHKSCSWFDTCKVSITGACS